MTNGFDAEQIWQQIDLQTQPLVSSLRRDVKRFERDEGEIRGFFQVEKERENVDVERESEEVERESESEEEDELELSELESEEEEERDGEGEGVEDKFLKIKELEEYMEDDEAREYGVKKTKKKQNDELVDDDDEEIDEDDDDEDDEVRIMNVMCFIFKND